MATGPRRRHSFLVKSPCTASSEEEKVNEESCNFHLMVIFIYACNFIELFSHHAVADILLWRRKNLSAGILLGITFIWFLFQVLDYTLITLLCRSTIFLMVGLFLWSNGAGFVNCPPPRLPDIRFSESTLRTFFTKIRKFSVRFYDITQGKDMRLFFVVLPSSLPFIL
ncbi:hypothetical protein QQ045_021089 [Rhodiola kirilowii]